MCPPPLIIGEMMVDLTDIRALSRATLRDHHLHLIINFLNPIPYATTPKLCERVRAYRSSELVEGARIELDARASSAHWRFSVFSIFFSHLFVVHMTYLKTSTPKIVLGRSIGAIEYILLFFFFEKHAKSKYGCIGAWAAILARRSLPHARAAKN